jgi:site-specific DNA recombinase
MQRTDTCDDQERDVRKGLPKYEVDPTSAEVITDEAMSGTKTSRPGYQKLTELIRKGLVRVLAVDDQSRLTRGDNAVSFITDLVYSGGRFISTGEGIDTNVTGWKAKVKMKEMHHGTTIDDLSRKVRHGQEGRVLNDESAGDFCFGFESFYLDDDWAERLARRGPKPKKGLRISEEEARWVLQAFRWFADGWKIGAVGRELTRLDVDKGRKATTAGWHRDQVRRMLTNRKYIGEWIWGATTTLRNSEGKTKSVPAAPGDVTVRHRPHLQIVPTELWERVQARLADLKETYGQKEGQRRRGARLHWNNEAARTLLGGVLVCPCGAKLWHCSGMGRGYYACPEHKKGLCSIAARVPGERAEKEMFAFLTELLVGWPAWLSDVFQRTQAAVRNAVKESRTDLGHDERRLAELRKELGVLVSELGNTGFDSRSVRKRIVELENEEDELTKRLRAGAGGREVSVPDETWVREQLGTWANDLRGGGPQASVVLRRAISEIRAESVCAPGKKRGFIRIHFHVNAWQLLIACMGTTLPPALTAELNCKEVEGEMSPEFTIALGEPTKLDRWAPEIARWREEGVQWEEIVIRTGLDLNRAYIAWKRYVTAIGQSPTD